MRGASVDAGFATVEGDARQLFTAAGEELERLTAAFLAAVEGDDGAEIRRLGNAVVALKLRTFDAMESLFVRALESQPRPIRRQARNWIASRLARPRREAELLRHRVECGSAKLSDMANGFATGLAEIFG